MRYLTQLDGIEFRIEILDEHTVRVGEQIHYVDFVSVSGQPVYSLIIDGGSFEAHVYPEEDKWQVILIGREYQVKVMDEREAQLGMARTGVAAPDIEFVLKAPLPGLIVSIPVEDGTPIKKGEVLLILESMKMQNELRSPRDGTVHSLRVKAGESVDKKQVLMCVN